MGSGYYAPAKIDPPKPGEVFLVRAPSSDFAPGFWTGVASGSIVTFMVCLILWLTS
jgi:hypothetical protein